MEKLPFLLGLSIAFNSTGIPLGGRSISVGFVLSAIYIILQLKRLSWSKLVIRSYGVCTFFPLVVFSIMAINNSVNFGGQNSVVFVSTFVLDFILFWCILLDSLKDDMCVDQILKGLSLGAAILAVLFILKVGVNEDLTQLGSRFSVLGMNSNQLGMIEGIAFIYTINNAIIKSKKTDMLRLIFFGICLLLQIHMILSTGSRTAFLIMGAGIIGSILLVNMSRVKKIIFVLVGLGAVFVGFLYIASTDPIVLVRLMGAVEEGDLAGREDIWETLMPFINETPFVGVGETGYNAISKKVFGDFLSPHNEIIYLLITTGYIGAILMVLFWGNSFWRGFKKYKNRNDSVAILLVIPVFLGIISQQIIYEKFGWIACAYMLSGSIITKEKFTNNNSTKTFYKKNDENC